MTLGPTQLKPPLWTRRWQRHFRSGATETRSIRQVLHDQSLAGERLTVIVRIAYAFPAFWMTTRLFSWEILVDVHHPQWLWPVAWLAWFEGHDAARWLLVACVSASWLSCACCAQRWARAAGSIGLLLFLGLCFATGKIHHLMHGWLFVLATFVALPRGWHTPRIATRNARVRALLIYNLAQTLFALTYALSGAGKILGSVYQALRMEVTSLHPEALARHVAARLLETADTSLLGNWVILHGAWLWPLVLATLYLQVFALHFASRPRLHRLFGFGVGAFHLSSALLLFIDFTPAMVLAAVLFGASATAPQPLAWRDVVRDLPMIGRLAQRWLPGVRPAQSPGAKDARQPAVQR